MPETEQQDKSLSEIVVKEAVGKGLDSPLRDSILEAVEEADGGRGGGRFPLAGAVFGLGAALGFLAGRQSTELEESPLEDIEEPEIIEDVTERAESQMASDETETEMESEEMEGGSGSRLPQLLLALGVVAGAVFLRRRMGGEEEEEWEPIEEFEPATSGEEDAEDESDEAEAEEEGDETEEAEEEEEEE
ncbi:hypothetical protein [Halopiger xanaduensis]|uniref:MYXO-CTERM domain-containing protein n=1 Tax=Halopiger xanaduensis (strain DSM 18323 / JCM 14033 / SH-6) TaxID=797210 RepID=F8D9V5_HALXS|nr:hypothetical protein [Halopiger xanaduensis]AEH35732.1 hypothetical protein Halxa_1098 [Halopiger xanaduensis SH-6]